MVSRKIWIGILIIVFMISISASYIISAASSNETETPTAQTTESEETTQADTDDAKTSGKHHKWSELTDEEKAQMKEKLKAMRETMEQTKEKWDALTDEQKNEIYDLQDQINDLQNQIIDKYNEFGVIDEDTASDMKTKNSERNSKMKEDGKMPGMGMKGRVGHGHGPSKQATTESENAAE